MDEQANPHKSKLRRESELDTEIPSQIPVTPPFPATQPQLTDEHRNQLGQLMQELLLHSHELSFEYSTLDCEEINICPLARKSRELFKTIKKLNELVKRISPQPLRGNTP